MAITGSIWLLRGLRGTYRVHTAVTGSMSRFFSRENRVAWLLRGSCGVALREGVTATLARALAISIRLVIPGKEQPSSFCV